MDASDELRDLEFELESATDADSRSSVGFFLVDPRGGFERNVFLGCFGEVCPQEDRLSV